MKQILLLAFAVLMITSCKTKYNTSAQNDIKGDFVISNVNYSKTGINVKSFGMMDAKCFTNSVWHFIPNNNSGTFNTLSSDKCSAYTVNYKWSIIAGDQFVLKFVGDDEKAKKVTDGYTFTITNQTDNSFTLVQSATLDGEFIKINYNFTRN